MSPQHCFVESLCIENYIHKNTVLLCNPPKNNNNNHLNFFVCNLYLLSAIFHLLDILDVEITCWITTECFLSQLAIGWFL